MKNHCLCPYWTIHYKWNSSIVYYHLYLEKFRLHDDLISSLFWKKPFCLLDDHAESIFSCYTIENECYDNYIAQCGGHFLISCINMYVGQCFPLIVVNGTETDSLSHYEIITMFLMNVIDILTFGFLTIFTTQFPNVCCYMG